MVNAARAVAAPQRGADGLDQVRAPLAAHHLPAEELDLLIVDAGLPPDGARALPPRRRLHRGGRRTSFPRTEEEETNGKTSHAVHRPVGRPAAGGAGRQVRRVGLRRPRAGLLGRPLRGRRGAAPTTATARSKRELLERHGLECWAIGAHLVGQAVCDPIDSRHQAVLPEDVWGDGDPEGVRQRAAEKMKDTARAAARLGVQRGHRLHRLAASGTCSTRSRPTTGTRSSAATRSSPSAGTRSSTCSTRRACASRSRCTPPRSPTTSPPRSKTLEAIGQREGFGINFDPSHFAHQFLDSRAFVERVRRPHLPRARQGLEEAARTDAARSSARTSTSASPSAAGRSCHPGHGDVDFEDLFRQLNRIGYEGPLSIEWEDSGMDRDWGAPDALAFVRRTDFAPSIGGLRRRLREGGLGWPRRRSAS